MKIKYLKTIVVNLSLELSASCLVQELRSGFSFAVNTVALKPCLGSLCLLDRKRF